MTRNIKLFVIMTAAIILLGFGLLIGVFVHNHSFDASLTTAVAPSDSAITIDGKKVGAGKWRVHSGNYTVSFVRTGFAPITKSIVVKSGQNYYLGEALVPSDPQFTNWYAEHPNDQRLAEGISGQSFDSNNSQTISNNAWLKQLPYINLEPYFRIDSGNSKKYPNDPTKFALYIAANSSEAKQQALAWLTSQGADISNLEIIYGQ